jgi:hypothetical protein
MKAKIACLSIILSITAAFLQARDYVMEYGAPYKTIGGRELQMDFQMPQPVGIQ